MALGTPDPRYTQSQRARVSFNLALQTALAFIGVVWSVFIVDAAFGLGLTRLGVQPHALAGLAGILFAPLLHAGFAHILSNTLPLFVSLTALLYFYPVSSLRVILGVWLGSGMLTWVIGHTGSTHVGASGLVYGLLAYVFVSGLLRRDMRSASVSLLVAFLYGSMIWGVLPTRPHMSWEMHLSGALIGVLLAFRYRNLNRMPLVRYDWEDDDSVPPWFPEAPRGGEGRGDDP